MVRRCSWRWRSLALARAAAVAVDAAATPQAARGRVRGGAPGRSRGPRTRWPRFRSTRSTTCPSRSWWTSTTPCAPATTNWLWPSRNSATTRPRRSARRSPTRRRRWRRRSTSARSSTTPSPRRAQQRRDLLTRVVVAAAKADRELDAQREAFEQLRDLVINAPTRLDALTQQMVDLTARIGPVGAGAGRAAQPIRRYRTGFGGRQRRNGQAAAGLRRPEHHQRPRPGGAPGRAARSGLVDADPCRRVGAGPGPYAAGRRRQRRHGHQPGGGHAAVGDRRHPERHQAGRGQLQQRNTPHAAELGAARDAAVRRVADAQKTGSADPLGAFTQLTKADADLDRLLASVAEEREAAERLSRAFDQALFTAQSRVRGVSDFIDTRRGSIGPRRAPGSPRRCVSCRPRRTRAANLKRRSRMPTAPPCWRRRRRSLANADVRAAQRSYTGQYGSTSGSDMGAVIGGIVIGNILSGALRGGLGGSMGGGWSPTSFGGSSGSSGGGYTVGGRF